MAKLLKDIIGNRRVEDLTCREANAIVSEFYLKVKLENLGRDQRKLDYLVNKTLARFGLEYFA